MLNTLRDGVLELVADAAARIDSLGWGEATAGNISLLLTPAALMIAFEGMHPTFRHTPPMNSRSTQITLLPCWAARMAAT